MKKKILNFAVMLALFTFTFMGLSFIIRPVNASAATVSINKKSARLYIGDTLQLTLKNASGTVQWKTSNKAVAKVSTKGKVTALKAGTATITATVSGKKYTCKVNVTDMLPLTADFIPDKSFRESLSYFDWDFDGLLSADEKADVDELILINPSSLKGVEFFTEIKKLTITGISVPKADFSKNTKLTYLDISYCDVENLNISQNTKLTTLICSNNKISKLDLSKNRSLKKLYCSNNLLTELDLSSNSGLEQLICYSNSLKALDISGLSALVDLNTSKNKLTSLDVSGLTGLRRIDCSSNKITKLTFSGNLELSSIKCNNNKIKALTLTEFPILNSLVCSDNQLTALDLSANSELTSLNCSNNKLKYLDLSNNTRLNSLYCAGNPMRKPNTDMLTALHDTEYPENLVKIDTYFPDKKLASIASKYDTDEDGQLSEKECDVVRSLDLTNSGISDLTGLDAFYRLESLDCSDNNIKEISLDLFYLQELVLHCSQVKTLNLNGFPGLKTLDCSCNPIETLDLSGNTQITELCISDTRITKLDISMLTDLRKFDCTNCHNWSWEHPDLGYYYTPLKTLTTGKSNSLYDFACNHTELTTLDLTGYPNIEYLTVSNNETLSKLLLPTLEKLHDFYCEWNNMLEELSINDAPELNRIMVYRNALKKLEIINCPNVADIQCGLNKLTEFSFTGDNLYSLDLSNNDIRSLSLSSYENLHDLNVSSTLIEDLDLSNLEQLRNVNCSTCRNLKNITLGHQAFRTLSVFACTSLTVLDLRNVTLDNQYALNSNNCSSDLQILY